MPVPWRIERLSRQHDRAPFDCGQPPLNEWLKHRSGQFDRRDLARTFVAVGPGQSRVLGYYAMSNHRVIYDSLPKEEAKGLPKMAVPVVLLGRLAADRTVQGRGLGAFLLMDALRRAQHIAEHVGVRAVEVDAIDGVARNFYAKYGFAPLLDDPNHLFLPMHLIRKLSLPSLP
jgi:GNAT superfamily N-acetyltransferase